MIAPAWNNEIERAEITVTLPGRVLGAMCSVGQGVGRPCAGLTVAGDTVRLSATDLQPPDGDRAGRGRYHPRRGPSSPWSVRWDRCSGLQCRWWCGSSA